MQQRLPKELRGPFVVGRYDRRKGRLYLKRPTGETQIVDDVTPALFIPKPQMENFPRDAFPETFTDMQSEGSYYRVNMKSTTTRAKVDEILHMCHDLRVYPREADVDPIRRWFSDTGAYVSAQTKALFFDLETDVSENPGFDDDAKKEHRLLSFSATDYQTGKKWFEINATLDDAGEARLLTKFLEIAENYDTLLAWNGDAYDFFVLRWRAKRLKIKVNWRVWNLLDYMLTVKKCLMSISDPKFKRSFALDNIGNNVLGISKLKVQVPMNQLYTLIRDDRVNELQAYNDQDVHIMTELEQAREFMELHLAVCSICRKFPDPNSLFPNTLMDGLMLRLAVQENRHFRSRFKDIEEEEQDKYPGAYVMDPVVGFHREIQVIDFSSLYPSIMISWNMSPDTKLWDNRRYDVRKRDIAIATATGVRFRTDFEGMLPKAERTLLERRKHYAGKQKNAVVGSDEWKRFGHESTALKVVANSMYGLLGSQYSRYFDRDIAQSVTLTGQLLIKACIEFSEDRGIKVIAGDSVTGDRPIVMMNPDGNIIIDKIENLWVAAIYYAHGKEYSELKGWKALTGNGWKPIKAFIRHKTNKTLYTIWNKYGQTTVTKDHSFVVDGKRMSPVELLKDSHLESKFEVVSVPDIEHKEHIDIFDEVKSYQFKYMYKGRHVIHEFCENNDYVYAVGWGGISQFFKRHYKSGTEELHSLLRTCADYLTEGSVSLRHVTTSRYLLSFSQKDREWFDSLVEDIQVVAPAIEMTGPTWSNGSGTYWFRSGTTSTSLFFDALCGHTSKGKRLPSFIFNLNDEDWNVFWNRMIEGDGHINSYDHFEYTSSSPALIAGLYYCLRMHNVDVSINYRREKHSWSIRARGNRFSHRPTKTQSFVRDANNEYVYDLSVEDEQTFVDGIGCIHLHNTDSCFVQATEADTKQLIEDINDELIPQLLEDCGCKANCIIMDSDKGYKYLLIQAKKKYAGKLSTHKGRPAPDDMEPEVKGLEFQRSDQIRIAQRMQMHFLHQLLDPNANAARIEKELRTWADKFMHGNVPREDIEITQGVRKHPRLYDSPTPAVRVAQQMIDSGMEFFPGMKVPYIVVSSKEKVEGIPADNYDGTFDRMYYWTNRVLPPVLRLVEARFPDYEFYDLVTIQKNPNQTTLDFAEAPVKTKKVKLPKRTRKTKKVKKVKLIKTTLEFDDSAKVETVISGVSKLVKGSDPGPHRIYIQCNCELGGENCAVTISTKHAVTKDCLKEISKMFPSVRIEPKPI